ncbi:MAG: MOSC domain-containing protein [Actinobacteria bacterium]|nr:MOSC domain-containing protein [Actinomycetota bacterium]
MTATELAAGCAEVLAAPRDRGTVELLVVRPEPGDRQVVAEVEVDPAVGLVGDCWLARGSRRTPDGSADPLMQVTLVNARFVDLVAGDRDRWPLAGDQVYVDLELGGANLPPGTHLALGTAVVEVTEAPHTGCAKFADRFGIDAARFVNSDLGRAHNLRGINTRVVTGGVVRTGDVVAKVPG